MSRLGGLHTHLPRLACQSTFLGGLPFVFKGWAIFFPRATRTSIQSRMTVEPPATSLLPTLTQKQGGYPFPPKNLQVLLEVSARRHNESNEACVLPRSLHCGSQNTRASGRDDRVGAKQKGKAASSSGLRSPVGLPPRVPKLDRRTPKRASSPHTVKWRTWVFA